MQSESCVALVSVDKEQCTFLPHVLATYGHHPVGRLIVEDITRVYIREYRPSQPARWYKQLSTTRQWSVMRLAMVNYQYIFSNTVNVNIGYRKYKYVLSCFIRIC